MKVLNHVVDVGEDGHEGDWFANSAACLKYPVNHMACGNRKANFSASIPKTNICCAGKGGVSLRPFADRLRWRVAAAVDVERIMRFGYKLLSSGHRQSHVQGMLDRLFLDVRQYDMTLSQDSVSSAFSEI